MKIKSKVSKFGQGRKMAEIPKAVRDNFEPGEEVNIEKTKGVKSLKDETIKELKLQLKNCKEANLRLIKKIKILEAEELRGNRNAMDRKTN